MHLAEIKIIDSFVVKTRGKVLKTDLPFTDENLKKINVGDTVDYGDIKYEIVSVESLYHSEPVEHGSNESIAFLVK